MADAYQFDWRGPQVEAEVLNLLHADMVGLGGFLVGHMQTYAPVRTGELRLGISDQYDPTTFTLTITIMAPYAVYVEFGTRNTFPHPYIRPTILDAAAAYPWIDWEVLLNLHPMIVSPSHLRASASGFRIPKSAKLTAKQLHHVQTVLRPTSRKFAGQFRRRKIGFKVKGPQ